jgi:hypothetical protein
LAEWGTTALYLALDTSTLWERYCLVRIWLPGSNGEIFSAKELRLPTQVVVSSLKKRPLNEMLSECL